MNNLSTTIYLLVAMILSLLAYKGMSTRLTRLSCILMIVYFGSTALSFMLIDLPYVLRVLCMLSAIIIFIYVIIRRSDFSHLTRWMLVLAPAFIGIKKIAGLLQLNGANELSLLTTGSMVITGLFFGVHALRKTFAPYREYAEIVGLFAFAILPQISMGVFFSAG